jgi:polar amino acid transport system substrate-binding protein
MENTGSLFYTKGIYIVKCSQKLKIFVLSIFGLFFAVSGRGENIQFVTENFPPFQVQETGTPLRGFAVELVSAMIIKAEIDAEIQVYPWARAYRLAQVRPNTFIFSIARSKEREGLFKWVGDYFTVRDGMFALTSRSDIVLNSINDARKYVTAVPRGDNAAVDLERLGFTDKHLNYVTCQTQCIKMLQAGRVDLNMNNNLGFFTVTEKLGFDRSQFKVALVLSEKYLGIAASRNTSDALVEKMRDALEEVQRDGTYARLTEKWFPGYPGQSP